MKGCGGAFADFEVMIRMRGVWLWVQGLVFGKQLLLVVSVRSL